MTKKLYGADRAGLLKESYLHGVPPKRELIPREEQVKQRSLGWKQRLSHQRLRKSTLVSTILMGLLA